MKPGDIIFVRYDPQSRYICFPDDQGIRLKGIYLSPYIGYNDSSNILIPSLPNYYSRSLINEWFIKRHQLPRQLLDRYAISLVNHAIWPACSVCHPPVRLEDL